MAQTRGSKLSLSITPVKQVFSPRVSDGRAFVWDRKQLASVESGQMDEDLRGNLA